MRALHAVAVVWMITVVAAPSCSAAAPGDAFAGTTKIVLASELEKDPAKKTVTVSDAAEIAKFLGAIKLEAKTPCACDHVLSAVFTTPAGDVRVSLCDHCFDFGGKTYKMPAAFYALFQAKFK